MALQSPHFLAGGDIPQIAVRVVGSSDHLAVGRKSQSDRLIDIWELTYFLAGDGVPESKGPASADGGDAFAVWRVRQRGNEEAVPPAHRSQAGEGAVRQRIAVAICADGRRLSFLRLGRGFRLG